MKKLVLLANTTQRDVWLGEAAMAGAKVSATGLRVTRVNGNEEQGHIVTGDQKAAVQWLTGQVYDEIDVSRLQPVAGEALQDALRLCLRSA